MLIFLAAIFPLIAFQDRKVEALAAAGAIRNEEEITIEENLHGGRVLVLSDGSTWEVAPQDLKTSRTWILAVPLKIEASRHPAYPHRLVNINSDTSILVRKIATSRSEPDPHRLPPENRVDPDDNDSTRSSSSVDRKFKAVAG
ncbi:MAG: hypothetical protein AAGE99_00690 [Chlamydiota bacterium]